MKLGRRLGVKEAKLQDIDRRHRQLCERGYHVLIHWKQKNGSAGKSWQKKARELILEVTHKETIEKPQYMAYDDAL